MHPLTPLGLVRLTCHIGGLLSVACPPTWRTLGFTPTPVLALGGGAEVCVTPWRCLGSDWGPKPHAGHRASVVIHSTRGRDDPGGALSSRHPALWGAGEGSQPAQEVEGMQRRGLPGEGAALCQVAPRKGPRREQPSVQRPGSHSDCWVGRVGIAGGCGEGQQGGQETPLATWRTSPSGAPGRDEGAGWVPRCLCPGGASSPNGFIKPLQTRPAPGVEEMLT